MFTTNSSIQGMNDSENNLTCFINSYLFCIILFLVRLPNYLFNYFNCYQIYKTYKCELASRYVLCVVPMSTRCTLN